MVVELGQGTVWEALYQLTSRLEARWLPPPPDTSVYYGYDPLPVGHFLAGLECAGELVRGRRFLDVGCGMGTKLALAHYLGWTVAGIERHHPYVEVAREFVPEAQIVKIDAFDNVDFDADVVYAYRPCVGEADQERLENHILSHMHRGSLFWLPGRALRAPLGIEQVGPNIWRA